jgi:hypothetical protein
MRTNTFIRIGKGFDIEVEADMRRDDARDPIAGRDEWVMVDGPVVFGPRGRQPLAERYHAKAAGALADAAVAFDAEDSEL